MRIEIYVTAGPAKGKHFTFDKPDSFLFGRAADAHISLPNDQYVSRQHFMLEIAPTECLLKDLNSKNGVMVNGVRYGGQKPPVSGVRQAPDDVREVHLKHGDEIIVGETHIKVMIRQEPIIKPTTEQRVRPQLPLRCYRCGQEIPHPPKIYPRPDSNQALCATCLEKLHQDELEKMLHVASREKEQTAVQPPSSSLPFVLPGYHIEQELKHAGTSKIYKAIKIDMKQAVVIKVLPSQTALDSYTMHAFQRELNIIRQLKHPHIVEYIEQGEREGISYAVCEFVDGMDLLQFIKSKGGRVSLEEAAPIWLDILDGLSYAHRAKIALSTAQGERKIAQGIVHRNLKPQNILLSKQGNRWVPKITDFGLAKSFESAGFTDITVPGNVLGTPVYWPREQISHYRYLIPASDVFSIAAVFYEMLTGSWVREGFKELFQQCRQLGRMPSLTEYMTLIVSNPPIPVRQRVPLLPEPVAQVLDRALCEQETPLDVMLMHDILQKLRYPDAGAFLDALRAAFDTLGLMRGWQPYNEALSAPPRKPAQEKTATTEAIMFSAIQPATHHDVALMLFDMVGSTQYLIDQGDTNFSTLIGTILHRVRKHAAPLQLMLLKSTGDGFLAVFPRVQSALSLAAMFLEKPIHPDIHVRIALHWGTVTTVPEGDVIGTEVRRVYRVEGIREEDRLDPASADTPLPVFDRILATEPFMEHLTTAEKRLFRPIGKFNVSRTGQLGCDLWALERRRS